MGIKHLHKFLLNKCTTEESIRRNVPFSDFAGKTLVIDASIYIYKFLEERALIENMYLFITILRHHSIIPVFIFDGKSPPEKKELLDARRFKKREAEKRYMELKETTTTTDDITERLESLRRQFIRMTNDHIQSIKDLFVACGVPYYEAEGEADALCVHMVLENKAWACISDDMDMFVYGCPRVIRNISMMNQTCMFYDFSSILKELDMTLVIFRQIMVLSGTDYNQSDSTDLNETLNWFYEYKKQMAKNKAKGKEPDDFYDWLYRHTKYITNFELLQKIYNLFVLDASAFPDIPHTQCLQPINDAALNTILEQEGFLIS